MKPKKGLANAVPTKKAKGRRKAPAKPKAKKRKPGGARGKPFDPEQPLRSGRQEKFCIVFVTGNIPACEAYRQAYGDVRGAEVSASRLLTSAKVSARMNALRQRAALSAVLTLAQKRAFLRRVVLTPIGEIDQHSDLCQSWTYAREGGKRGKLKKGKAAEGNEDEEPERELITVKVPDKLRAIELDATLAGELKPTLKVDAGDELLELLALIREGK